MTAGTTAASPDTPITDNTMNDQRKEQKKDWDPEFLEHFYDDDDNDSTLFVLLDNKEAMLRHRSFHRSLLLSKKTKKKMLTTPTKTKTVRLPDSNPGGGPPLTLRLGNKVANDEVEAPFGGSIPEATMGTEVNLKPSKSLRHRSQQYLAAKEGQETMATEEQEEGEHIDVYATNLNWATNENPDGVPLVHDVFDQGNCGSCWAYAATGSLETSVARSAAQTAYQHGLSLEQARKVQAQVFNQTRLSIQELLDCDHVVDQGCVGGNPLLAFYYIHKHGLTTWDGYPYDGQPAATCRRRPETPPHVAVDAWGILPQNHEDMIQIAIRYIGPVAAAINGADPYFMAYQGGIFDNPYCGQEPNHAVLITGYGSELDPTTNTTIRYWIARNSWGRQWGEDGYMRIRRGSGQKKVPGICGVARSPSVALGGRLLGSSRWASMDATTTTTGTTIGGGDDYLDPSWDGLDTDMHLFCKAITPQNSLAHVRCRRLVDFFNSHRAAALASISLLVVLLLAWPLTYSCRRSAEARKFRKKFVSWQWKRQQQQQQYQNDSRAVPESMDETEVPFRVLEDTLYNENTPLLGQAYVKVDLPSPPIAQPSTPLSIFDGGGELRSVQALSWSMETGADGKQDHTDHSPDVTKFDSSHGIAYGGAIVSNPTSPVTGRVLADYFENEKKPLFGLADLPVDSTSPFASSPTTPNSFRVMDGTFEDEKAPLLGLADLQSTSPAISSPSSPLPVPSTKDAAGDKLDVDSSGEVVVSIPIAPVVGGGAAGEGTSFHSTTARSTERADDERATVVPIIQNSERSLFDPDNIQATVVTGAEETLSLSSVEESDHPFHGEDDNDEIDIGAASDSSSPLKKYGGLALYRSLSEDSGMSGPAITLQPQFAASNKPGGNDPH